MEVKTGQLRDHLSRYLKRVQQTGDSLVVMDRNTPVAEIHPFRAARPAEAGSVWAARRQMEQTSEALDEDFELPQRSTLPHKQENPLD
jgi:antitoxin (DNA-binding transcriptional repressor) of toxin-antitoxin stability system